MLHFFQFSFGLDLLQLFNWLVFRYDIFQHLTLLADLYLWCLFDLVPCCRCTSGSTTAAAASASSSATSTSVASSSASCSAFRPLCLWYWLDLFALPLLTSFCALRWSRLLYRCSIWCNLLNWHLVRQLHFRSSQRLLTVWRTALLLVCLQPPSEGNKLLDVLSLFDTV